MKIQLAIKNKKGWQSESEFVEKPQLQYFIFLCLLYNEIENLWRKYRGAWKYIVIWYLTIEYIQIN